MQKRNDTEPADKASLMIGKGSLLKRGEVKQTAIVGDRTDVRSQLFVAGASPLVRESLQIAVSLMSIGGGLPQIAVVALQFGFDALPFDVDLPQRDVASSSLND